MLTASQNLRRFFALFAVSCLLPGCSPGEPGERTEYQPAESTAIPSTELSATEIVPTLDTPLAESGNAVWCATFQVAWNRACDDMIGGPLQVASAEDVAERLNNSQVMDAALPPDDFYATAGRLDEGISGTIREEMAQRFPHAAPPEYGEGPGFVAYAYLETQAMFTTPFSDTKRLIRFTDSGGIERLVHGFGLNGDGDWDLKEQQAAQVKVLLSQTPEGPTGQELTAFALDLTADQSEQQVIVAVLPRAENLRAALDDLQQRMEDFPPNEFASKLQATDMLSIPNVAFNVIHEFAELQGGDKVIENPGEFQGMYVQSARQSIDFRLDKSGATVVSESDLAVGAEPRRFIVDRPFLVVMKRRSAEQPYFVAWIDNAELLEE